MHPVHWTRAIDETIGAKDPAFGYYKFVKDSETGAWSYEAADADVAPLIPGPVARGVRLYFVIAELLGDRAGSNTPEAIINEASLRAGGWLKMRLDMGNIVQTDQTVFGGAVGLSCLRHSGALALIGPWIQRRAGKCEPA